jgi:arginase family enzyme
MIDMRAWSRGQRPSPRGPLYLSVDLDAIDPAYAPGVSHPEPGGLSVREVLEIIHALPGPIAGADIVELNPTRDLLDGTARVAAKLVKEIAGRMLELASIDGHSPE